MYATWSWQNAGCLPGLIGVVPASVTCGASNDAVGAVTRGASSGGVVAVVSLVVLQATSATAANVKAMAFFIWPLQSSYSPSPVSDITSTKWPLASYLQRNFFDAFVALV
jgi:hypothetical protein